MHRATRHGEGIALLSQASFRPGSERLDGVVAALERHPAIRAVEVTSDAERIAALADDVIVAAGSIAAELLERMPRLVWYQQWGAGADWLLQHRWVHEAGFTITNVAGIHGIQIGEHVFMTLLALGRRLPEAVRAQHERRWFAPEGETLEELEGKRLLLCGYGGIGARVARLARAFGMTIDVVRRSSSEAPPGVERVGGLAQLDAFLPDADAVVISLPLTSATRGRFGAAELARMRKQARLINVGRGGLVDETALLQALREGRLAGAALDVFEEEPLPASSPLWEAPNLLITGHYAGATERYDERAMAIFGDNVERFVAGEPLTHVVDKERGY